MGGARLDGRGGTGGSGARRRPGIAAAAALGGGPGRRWQGQRSPARSAFGDGQGQAGAALGDGPRRWGRSGTAVGGATLDGRAAREGVDCRRCVGKWATKEWRAGQVFFLCPAKGEK